MQCQHSALGKGHMLHVCNARNVFDLCVSYALNLVKVSYRIFVMRLGWLCQLLSTVVTRCAGIPERVWSE